MAVTFANIVVGEGTLFVGSNTGGAATYDVGATQEGVTISWEPDMVDIEVDQFGDAARVIQSKVKVMVKTTLAENSLSNLALAWGYAASTTYGDSNVASNKAGLTSTTALNFGIHNVIPEERKLVVTGPAAGSTAAVPKTRTYSCNRAVSYNSTEIAHQRTENAKLAVEFRILPDPTQTGKEYGTISEA